MNIKQYEEEIKKGCRIIFGDSRYKDMNPRPCGFFDGEVFDDKAIRLCDECRMKFEIIQKCKEIFKEMINNAHIEFREDTSKNIKIACGWAIVGLKNDLLSQLGEEQ